ncbi:MAG: DUF296 domain-containing protein [Candidatus Bipolaricaulota bacterium]|nr:DUF296 domain-containing protein [Candidatus Bipolaricaulota bacterium]MDW8126310.1 DUF296 domain-containing protein [Candidatus Bipolaricaulota bacterium]
MIFAKAGEVHVVRLQDGEELPHALCGVTTPAAVVCGVGMLREVRLGYWEAGQYLEARIGEPVELLSLQGNVGEGPEGPVVHLHVVLGKKGGEARGGHLLGAVVHNTAEVVVLGLPGIKLVRRPEPTGLLGLYPEGVDSGEGRG